MAAMTDYTEAKVLNRLLNAQADTDWPVIATVAVALYTTAPNDDGTGGVEVSGGSYVRKTVTAGFTVATSGGVTTGKNTAAITFVTPTANWGTVVAFAVFDDAGTPNMILLGALTTSRVINSGALVQFIANDLVFEAK